ncbi:hypothetical protein BH23ACT10_BH23ACT10_06530 [soil metagenome]
MTIAHARVLDRDLTWRQFLDLPHDDRYRHAELINGEVVVTTPTPLHQPPAFDQAPDLVVEVLSPSTRSFDAIRKCRDYAAIGVAELWLIDPDGPEATILRVSDAVPNVFVDAQADIGPDDLLSSPQLPGFTVRLGDLTER